MIGFDERGLGVGKGKEGKAKAMKFTRRHTTSSYPGRIQVLPQCE